MHLDNFVEVISGKLFNEPCISFINNISTKVENIKNGDVFIARNKLDISLAVEYGAYAIVSDEFVEIIDNEVAWIIVQNIDDALLKYIKYIKLINNIDIYLCDKITFLLAKNTIQDNQVSFASSIDELVENLFFKIIIINFDILLFKILKISDEQNLFFKIIKQSLFELKIEYENQIYEIILPSIFTNMFNNIVGFCKLKHVNFTFHIKESLFLPIFINRNAKVSKYGYSMRFIYASIDGSLIRKYIDFMPKWGKTLFLYPKIHSKNTKKIKESILNKEFNSNEYKSKENLIDYFLLDEFHFFIVFGMEQKDLLDFMSKDIIEPSLF